MTCGELQLEEMDKKTSYIILYIFHFTKLLLSENVLPVYPTKVEERIQSSRDAVMGRTRGHEGPVNAEARGVLFFLLLYQIGYCQSLALFCGKTRRSPGR